MEDYKPARKDSRVFNRRVRNRIVNLAVQLEESADAGEFQDHVVDFYREFGVGKFGLNKAFRIIEREEGQPVIIDPIINVEHIYFKDIVGYELQKQKLIENTEAFVEGKEANNVLLFGDAGTGKSSSARRCSMNIMAGVCASLRYISTSLRRCPMCWSRLKTETTSSLFIWMTCHLKIMSLSISI